MKTVRLDVPLVRQDRSMECWYASVCMVCYFHLAGPRYGVPVAWTANKGLPLANFSTLAQNEHLEPVAFAKDFRFTADELCDVLRRQGPIWAWGMWFGLSHIVVVTGVENGNVLVNDPDGPKRTRFGVAQFNKKVVRNYPKGSDPLLVYRYPDAARLQKATGSK